MIRIVCICAVLSVAYACEEEFNLFEMNCTTHSECGENSRCDAIDLQCICNRGYIQYQTSTCSYKQKEQWLAFLLSLFIGWTGADQFYLGWDNFGAGKLVFLVPGFCIVSCLFVIGTNHSQVRYNCLALALLYLYAFGFLTWYLYDLIQIGVHYTTDAHGAPMKCW